MAELKNVAPLADFDWNAYESGDTLVNESREAQEKAYEGSLNKVNDHEVVDGTVIAMNKREVVVNIGFKSDGIIPMSEFRYNPDLKVGDKVEVYIENQEDKKGQLILSHKKARATRSWDRVNEALENEEIIKGYIKCRTKGGMIVDVFGIEAFLPGSQIDVKPIRDYDVYVDKTMEFKVVKINQEFRNVVVSHKALIEAELEAQKQIIMSKLEKGQILEGTVKNITSYGVFVDLGGVDGLIHITDLSWGRVNHPEEIVKLDQKIHVVILDFDDQKKRIALGLKQLTPHPWEALDPNLKVGDKVKGRVVVMADYGAFVEIAPGVEGLIHVSEMSWSQHLRSAQEFLKVGDEVEAVILTLDREERKMSLGIKQLTPDPWADIETRYPVGTKCKAKVRNFTNFGVFVEIEEGIDGLIHISDLSWTKKVKHPGRVHAGRCRHRRRRARDRQGEPSSLAGSQAAGGESLERDREQVPGRLDPRGYHHGADRQGRRRIAGRERRGLLPDASAGQGGRHERQGRREARLQGDRVLEGYQAYHPFARSYVRGGQARRSCSRES